MSEPQPELSPLEQALRELAPRPALDRDRVVFEAGRASVVPRGHWPHACAALAALLLVSLSWHWLRPDAPPIERVVLVPTEAIAPSPTPAPTPRTEQADYLRRRELVMHDGVEALPRGPLMEAEGRPLTPASVLEQP